MANTKTSKTNKLNTKLQNLVNVLADFARFTMPYTDEYAQIQHQPQGIECGYDFEYGFMGIWHTSYDSKGKNTLKDYPIGYLKL